MRKLTISGPARADLVHIRSYTLDTFGEAAAVAYRNLIERALEDIRENPMRLGTLQRSEIEGDLRSYHTASAKSRSFPLVKKPRHFILFFEVSENEVVISRVLHERQDIGRHIPDAHIERSESDAAKRKAKSPRRPSVR